ncbi:hypothetical protein EDC04DRAFT_1624349 [Pisolithus marmoratus]|nr:hypothetical protein EDC04DRAFT_1624349 [Pisolithus marmoratus]
MSSISKMYDSFYASAASAPQASNIDYDRRLDTPSMVQEIKTLQAKLNETVDEDEQRALEEDVTGKILWLCWCGICAEVEELLPKVVDYLQREATMVCTTCPWLYFSQWVQTRVMMKLTCSGSCMMLEQARRNISCCLSLEMQSKPSGQARIGAPPS